MIHTRHAAARVDFHLVEPGEFKHLRVNLQAVTCPHVPDTVLLFFAAPVAGKLPASRGAYPFTSREVQEILPVARNRALLQLAALIGKVEVLAAQSKLCQFILAINTKPQIEK